MDEELLNQLIEAILGGREEGEGEIRSPRTQTLPPREMLEAAADVARVAPRARAGGPRRGASIGPTPDPPFGNVIAQIVSGIEKGVIEGTPLDPREMGEESPIRPAIEGLLNRLRGPSGPTPGEGIPGLELAALFGAGAVTPGPGEFRNIVGIVNALKKNPNQIVSMVLEDAPAIDRSIRSADSSQLLDVMEELQGPILEEASEEVKTAAMALFSRLDAEILGRAARGGGDEATNMFRQLFGDDELVRMFRSRLDEVEELEALTRFKTGLADLTK